MSRAHKFSNLMGVAVPFVAFLDAIVLLWNTWVDWSDSRSSRSCTCSRASA